ncbi:hypothetical protein [Corynebacterium sp. HMSC034A01]|uniref:hypothetical protein n=1 Tax=Corynebacterium sp. HMSC034A01 TaxID=1739295 RepID=UPI001FEDE07F|nr:hypothetical protein [Corynebacterium sp. HMSC034A01]
MPMNSSQGKDAGGCPTESFYGKPVDAKDVAATLKEILDSENPKGWRKAEVVKLGKFNWRPSALSADGRNVLYVFLDTQLPLHTQRRLKEAKENGFSITIALTVAALYKPELVSFLVSLDSDVLVVDDLSSELRFKPRSVLVTLAEVGVPLSPEHRRNVGELAWANIDTGTPQERGQRLEGLLAFLFAQVRDLKLVSRNYRTETEEIDLVLQVDNFSPRVWLKSGTPFILVEAKNRAEKASQQVVSVLLTKLQTNRGSSRIAFLVSLSGFTESAMLQELRFSSQDSCVVMIDRLGIEELIRAEDLDATLEKKVVDALLR